MILVVGARGGIGTTTMALKLIRATPSIGLDAWDGALATRLERPTLNLMEVALSGRWDYYMSLIESRKITLLWTEECPAYAEKIVKFLGELNALIEIIADGGVAPPPQLTPLVEATIIVSKKDDQIAQYHERRLTQMFPKAFVVYAMDDVLTTLREEGIVR